MPSHCLRFGYDRAHLRRLQSIVSVLTTLCVCTLFSVEVLTLQWARMKCDVRIEAECVCRFCFDVPGIFLGWLRGLKDRIRSRSRRSSRHSLAIAPSATRSSAIVVRNRCLICNKGLCASDDDIAPCSRES